MEIQLMIHSPAISPYATAPSSPIHPGFQTHDNDFAFDFSKHLLDKQQLPSISPADELFHRGKIKPLNPPSHAYDPRFTEAVSNSNSNTDSFTETFNRTPGEQTKTTQNSPKRGRETKKATGPRSRKVSRSSSPFRISDILSEKGDNNDNNRRTNYLSWYNKWNLKNLLLFRSASEGSARRRNSKDPVINRYSRIRKDDDDDVKNYSSCSSEVVVRRRVVMRKVSAHEMHYTANRAVAEEMRRRTLLPYKSGLLGCLGLLNCDGEGRLNRFEDLKRTKNLGPL